MVPPSLLRNQPTQLHFLLGLFSFQSWVFLFQPLHAGSCYDFLSNTEMHFHHQISFSSAEAWKPCLYLLPAHQAASVNQLLICSMLSSRRIIQGGCLNSKHWCALLDGWMQGKQGWAVGHLPVAHPSGSGTRSTQAHQLVVVLYNEIVAERLQLCLSLIKRQPENCPLPRAPALSLWDNTGWPFLCSCIVLVLGK